METVIRNVGDIDSHDRQALEHVLGQTLRANQQLVIRIVNLQVQPDASAEVVPQDRNGDGTVLDANGNIAEWSDWIIYRAGLVGNTSCVLREVNPTGVPGTGPTEVLASNLSLMNFRRQAATADIIEATVSCYTVTEKGQQMTRAMSTRVKLRN